MQENEAVVDYALRNRFVKVIEMGLPIGEPGLTKFLERRYNSELKKSRRIYPHVHNLDGFFIVKLQKIEAGNKKVKPINEKEKKRIRIEKHGKKDS